MQQKAHYRAFGLVIASDQRITNLSEISAATHDVEITVVAPDHEFDDARLRNQFANWLAGPNACC